MKSLLIMSQLLALLVIPALAARTRSPRRGLRLMLLLLLIFNLAYVGYMTMVHTELYVPKW